MGIDLTLLVVDGNCGTWGYAHTVIELGRNHEVFDSIKSKCNPHERRDFEFSSFVARVPDGSFAGEKCYGKITHDAYGERIKFVYANDLVKSLIGIDQSSQEMAAVAYLDCLKPDTLVGLYWH